MRLSFSNCHFKYSRNFSAVSLALKVAIPVPFLGFQALIKILIEHLRSNNPIISDTVSFGAIDVTQ